MPTPMMTARVAPEVVAELDAIAEAAHVTRTDLVRAALAELLDDPSRFLARLDEATQERRP